MPRIHSLALQTKLGLREGSDFFSRQLHPIIGGSEVPAKSLWFSPLGHPASPGSQGRWDLRAASIALLVLLMRRSRLEPASPLLGAGRKDEAEGLAPWASSRPLIHPLGVSPASQPDLTTPRPASNPRALPLLSLPFLCPSHPCASQTTLLFS